MHFTSEFRFASRRNTGEPYAPTRPSDTMHHVKIIFISICEGLSYIRRLMSESKIDSLVPLIRSCPQILSPLFQTPTIPDPFTTFILPNIIPFRKRVQHQIHT